MTRAVGIAGHETMDLDDFEELLADRPSDEKWELIDGRVVRLMVGARWEHGRIVQNIARHTANRLDVSRPNCQVFAESFFLKQTKLRSAMLPDVMVLCGALEPGATSTEDPVVVFEVMSAGSEARDRFEKWSVYQRLPSLQHYVLVTRDQASVELYSRVDGAWSGFTVLEGLDAVLALPAIDVALPLSAIYERVLR